MTLNLQECSTVIPPLDAYHDDELDGDEKASVELHLRACDACPQRLAQITKLVSALKLMPFTPSKIDFADRFELRAQEIASVSSPSNGSVLSGKFGKIGAIAAAVALFLGVGAYFVSHDGSSTRVATIPQANSMSIGQGANSSGNMVKRTLDSEQLASSKIAESPALTLTETASTGNSNADHKQTESQSKQTSKIRIPRTEVATVDKKANLENVVASNVISKSAPGEAQITEGRSSDGPKHSLVAYYESDPNSIPEELGISTDEDGLYAIKM